MTHCEKHETTPIKLTHKCASCEIENLRKQYKEVHEVKEHLRNRPERVKEKIEQVIERIEKQAKLYERLAKNEKRTDREHWLGAYNVTKGIIEQLKAVIADGTDHSR